MPSATPLAHLSANDRTLFYKHGFGPVRPVSTPIIHHAFKKHALEQPEAIAVEHLSSNESITYAHLDARSNQLAHTLRARNIVPGRRVCILARRSIALIVGILAVLKSGAQYVPLDALSITDETLQFVLEDSTPSLVLVMEEFAHRVTTAPKICLEHAIRDAELSDSHLSDVEDMSSVTDGAYCIYTSGTTGRPKGVDVKHQGVTNVIGNAPANVGMRRGMRVAQLLNIAFDMGAWEILGSLYNGATLCIRGNTSKEWIALMKTVDIVIATPSILACHEPENYPGIKEVIVGGEPCPQGLADKWARHTKFNNCCGPTEISICNTVQRHTSGYPLSIGKPIPNTNVYILSRDPNKTRPVPIGQVGCMWVGGTGVGWAPNAEGGKKTAHTGYLNLPEKNAERWRPDPFVKGGMMFNTGDLGRWRKDGQLDHMGRADDQVKVKGFRVELDGVSAAMRTYPPVLNAVTLLVNSKLWGFVTPASVDTTLVRTAVAKIQPHYAVPAHYMALEEFPTTRNGKVDKRALSALAEGGMTTSTSVAAEASPQQTQTPSAPTEQRVSTTRNADVLFAPSVSMVVSGMQPQLELEELRTHGVCA